MFDDQEHRLDRGLPLLELLFGLGQLLDIPGSFLEGDELAAAAAGAAGGANGGMSRTFTFERFADPANLWSATTAITASSAELR
jgi:hypothetical protein